jgi:hypothetical protein
MSNNALSARVVKAARKPHKCFACLCDIPVGYTYIAYPGKNDAGVFGTTHLCIECSYLLTQKTGPKKFKVREGEFTERQIPNFLRKKRTAFRKNPKETIKQSGLMQST